MDYGVDIFIERIRVHVFTTPSFDPQQRAFVKIRFARRTIMRVARMSAEKGQLCTRHLNENGDSFPFQKRDLYTSDCLLELSSGVPWNLLNSS